MLQARNTHMFVVSPIIILCCCWLAGICSIHICIYSYMHACVEAKTWLKTFYEPQLGLRQGGRLADACAVYR